MKSVKDRANSAGNPPKVGAPPATPTEVAEEPTSEMPPPAEGIDATDGLDDVNAAAEFLPWSEEDYEAWEALLNEPASDDLEVLASLPAYVEMEEDDAEDSEAISVSPEEVAPTDIQPAPLEAAAVPLSLAVPEEIPLAERPPTRTERSGPRFSAVLFSWSGSENHDYEDAGDAAPDSGHAAIADGTTLGGMSGIIARGLVRHFVSGQYDLDNDTEVAAWWLETRREWSRARKECYDRLSSVEQQKMDRGGSATFMALRLLSPTDALLYWVGDCTLFLIPAAGGEPDIRGATEFDSHPAVIHYFDDHPERHWRREEIPLAPYRFAAFCTDALAKGLLEATPWQEDPAFWHTLRHRSAEEYRDWVQGWRDSNILDADDYTLLLLELPEIAEIIETDGTEEKAGATVPEPEAVSPDSEKTTDDADD